ncbi:hypothetical protein PsYK624_011300 [Phanerochaete sordida]|uniref:Uncharacterized protein n=1 Tax=Phanerochaete sordida TaxID=48140 RepID=A0A9P3FXM9_9APHY|nr:hypothetical protein PsYK624_011300 [Phanerochaete sordida]
MKAQKSLSEVILRDGTLYFISLLLLNVVTVLQIRFTNESSSRVLEEALSATFASRFMLSLRSAAASHDVSQSDTSDARQSEFPGLRFVSTIAEDFGPTLDFATDLDTDSNETNEASKSDCGYIVEHARAVPSDDQLDTVVHSTIDNKA